ncbi:hypothetical protein FOMPIDRAFT_1043035 [Fomitopsis schrenkii]|uniref:Fibronectin type-III domain-containing protein n=1 Tax=Fomitopsis schrenkii TaxID=2126942 RepID=S8F5A7_FOMSC|nr:hypothetical protein FOMPIDRAFT_1043035 [Fomitopsis schrenkii]
MVQSQESFMFTVGKLDAGMAILLGERAHLIEFPSLLLPPGATTGSIVNISVQRNVVEEKRRDTDFWSLQNDVLQTYGTKSPENPQLEVRNVTQTSVTLEWPALKLATAKLRSLDIYRNRQRLASIPSPLTNTSTKLSGLQIDTEYTFQLVLRTTAGVFPSNLLRVRTHTMTDTSGICVCFGNVQDPVLLENSKMALQEMGAKWSDKIEIDTTHFVCTTPAATPGGAAASGGLSTAPGVEYQKALQLSIPVVQPHWILACHSGKKMVPIHPYYLGATPPMPTGQFSRPQSMSQASLSRAASGSPSAATAAHRQSMPPQRVASASPPAHSRPRFEPMPEEQEEGEGTVVSRSAGHVRKGTMTKNFKFPPPAQTPPPPLPPVPTEPAPTPTSPPKSRSQQQQAASPRPEGVHRAEAAPSPGVPPSAGRRSSTEEAKLSPVPLITPSVVEVPPPPPVDKEVTPSIPEGDDDLGETEEISLN